MNVENANPTAIFKKSKRPKNLRKRDLSPKKSPNDSSSEEETKIFRKEKNFTEAQNPSKKIKEEMEVLYNANYDKNKKDLDVATSYSIHDTEHDKDATALLEKKKTLSQNIKAATSEATYEGQIGYSDYIKKENENSNKHSKIKVGPLRAPTNIRVTCRFDYQQGVCKDYKETGYCGFGDGCVFMHDRGDYKTGWELEREWEEEQKKKKKELDNPFEEEKEEEVDELPFACFICRDTFTNPVVTKCLHYFCEACALKNFRENSNCYVCGEPTGGIFDVAKNLLNKLSMKKNKVQAKNEDSDS